MYSVSSFVAMGKNTNSGKDFTKVVRSSYFRTAVVCSFRENLGFAITMDFINNL